jgi:iron complex transport system ATP-binding protein
LADEAIRFTAVTARYGDIAAVRDVSFSIRGGELVGLIGPNGSGKSTLIRLMSSVLQPWQGRVEILGKPLPRYRQRELGQALAVVPQETTLSSPFSVMEVVLFGRTPHLGSFGFEGERDLAATRRAMERTNVGALASRTITELSGGERQRVILARALAQEPKILILDEPSAFLDIRHQVETYDLLRELQREGMTIVTVLHDLNLAALYCERLILLDRGHVARDGSPADVLTYPLLTQVYGVDVYVTMNDVTGTLNVLPLSRVHRQRK